MDLFSFINSKDIESFLRGIGYDLTSLEAAWLVWQSHRSMEDKHEGWQYIIDTMPDCRIEERCRTTPRESLHGYLVELIELEKTMRKRFLQNEGCVYLYGYREPEMAQYEEARDCVFASYEACLREVVRQKSTAGTRYVIHKLGTDVPAMSAWLNEGYEIKTMFGGLREKEIDFRYTCFEGMWFEFPVPFRKGDILRYAGRRSYAPGSAFVLDKVATKFEHAERWKWSGDYTDMEVDGYFLKDNGTVYRECSACYMDLEYVREELHGIDRVLKPLSGYLKGEIDLCLFAEAYRIILAQEQIVQSLPTAYTKEGLRIAGIL